MFPNIGSIMTGPSQLILIKFVAIYLILIGLTMIPGWITATKIEKSVKAYFSFIFNFLEQSCVSINELKKAIVSYNKIKFIENNTYPENNTFIYLEKNEGKQNDKGELNITFRNENLSNKIDVSKVTLLDPEINIVITTSLKATLSHILPKNVEVFYAFDIKKLFNPLLMVKPKLFLLIFLFILAILLTSLWVIMKAYFFQKRQLKINILKLETSNIVKVANLNFLNITLDHIFDDLNDVFLSANFEHKDLRPSLEKKMEAIRQSLGRIITFGTMRHDYSKIGLTQEINNTLDCFLEQISHKGIFIIKNNFDDKIYIQQTKLKNLLILLSVIHHFIINLPPKGQLTITINEKNEHSIEVIFCDNMPLDWKLFEQENGKRKGFNSLLFTFEKLMYACADEEIKATQDNNTSGNYIILEYKRNRVRNDFNVIQGDFR